jgi:hypothetical protein
VFFSMLTNGKVTGDKVGPHNDLLDDFPYLAPGTIRGRHGAEVDNWISAC